MDRNELAVIAKGVVPFVRDEVMKAVSPLLARLEELETRPTEKGPQGPQGERGERGAPGAKGEAGEVFKLSPDLAEQVASAVRLLHELPPPIEKAAPPPRAPRIARVERDEAGNFIPVYEAQP